jgi:hypothetical protein
VPVSSMPSLVLEWGLGAGEAEVIAVVLEGRGRTAVLDDAQGRKCARALCLPLIICRTLTPPLSLRAFQDVPSGMQTWPVARSVFPVSSPWPSQS